MTKKSAFDEKSRELQSNIDKASKRVQAARALDFLSEEVYWTKLLEARAALNAHLVAFIDERRREAGLAKSEVTVEKANAWLKVPGPKRVVHLTGLDEVI